MFSVHFGILRYTVGSLMMFPKLKPKESKARPGTWIVSVPASFSISGKRENHYFRNKNTALEWVVRYKGERNEHGKGAIMPDERTALMFFKEHVGDLKLLPDVVRHWLTTSSHAVEVTLVSDVVDRFLEWRAHQG